jgi:hypothetical protein
MRDMIKKALQLGFAQRLCLFTLADNSAVFRNLKIRLRFYYGIAKLSSLLRAATLRFLDLIIKCGFHYE